MTRLRWYERLMLHLLRRSPRIARVIVIPEVGPLISRLEAAYRAPSA